MGETTCAQYAVSASSASSWGDNDPVSVNQDAEEATTTSSSERLAELAAHPSKKVRRAAADNPVASDQLIMMLANDSVETVRLSAAAAATNRPSLHEALSRSEDKWVRAILAHSAAIDETNQLPHDVQLRFARDDFKEVRERIAHTTAFLDIFGLLLSDPDPYVRGFCASNPRITESQMDRLVADKSWVVRASSLSGLRFPRDEQVIALASDRSVRVRDAALLRVDTPSKVVELLLDDSDEIIRNHARLELVHADDPPSERTLWVRSARERASKLTFR